VAPDYLLCHESVASKFQQELVKAFQRYVATHLISSLSTLFYTCLAVFFIPKRLFLLLCCISMYSSCEDKSDMTRIVTPAHAERLVKMIKEVEEAGCKIILGGSTLCNPSGRFITPTIVLNPPMTSALMTEEVFGPVLPLITVR
jgi:acyl-CoA reductase-like NAD-dependent aldehyde dehydrogenase